MIKSRKTGGYRLTVPLHEAYMESLVGTRTNDDGKRILAVLVALQFKQDAPHYLPELISIYQERHPGIFPDGV